MCVQVGLADTGSTPALWNRDDATLLISDQVPAEHRLTVLRAMLITLGAPTCQTTPTCWCGEPVALPGQTLQDTLAG